MIRRLFAIAVLLALLCGTVLSLPVFWARPVVGQKSSQIARHWLDCIFTASSALTGTGLSPHDIGDDFTPAGQALILGYMQIGGLGVLVLGAIVGLRFRQRFGWGTDQEGASQVRLGRLIAFVCVLALLLEAAGAAALCYSPDRGSDPSERPLFTALFHSVSAFCNTGLTLTRDSFLSAGVWWPVYAVLLPLMVLGGIGGPVLYELWRRLLGSRSPLSRDTQVTLIGTAMLILAGAATIFFIESTPRWQLRNPREDSEHIKLAREPAGEVIEFSSEGSSRASQQRLRTMNAGRRAAAALFQSVSARSTGFRVARLDEQSLSPADRAATMLLMLIGGGIGGTAGGLRIVMVAILLGTLLGGRRNARLISEGRQDARPPIHVGQDACSPIHGQDVHPPIGGQDARAMAVQVAAGVATAMLLLIAFTALVLIYREPASFEACVFEALSACCNVGFTTGITRSLQPESQVMVILAMLLGRILPLAVLANCLWPPAAAPRSKHSTPTDQPSALPSAEN